MVGQEHVTDPLSTALDTGRISHAYLFSGPRGCGKTSSARILARSLNCVEGPTSRPCGVCASCVALAPGGPGNLDVIELDAASHGGVDDTRELRDRAFYAPAESRYRVFIVDEAHMVTTAGFNALLKIVEEPPAHLIFVFATTEPDKVLPTIRSRTHHYPFRLLPPATMRGLLGGICEQEGVQVEEAVYPLVIRAGGGSPRDSLSVLDQLLAGAGPEGVTYPRALALLGVTDIALIDDAVEALATDDGAVLFGTIDRVVEAGHDPRRFATDLLERVRDLILLRAVPDAAERNLVTGPGDVLDRMRDQAQRIGPATLARYAELLHEGLGEMRGATAPRLLLEVVCARMLLPSVSDAESATLQRLERVERHLSGTPVPPPATTPPAPPAQPSGEPRRRGAEALAAIRETRSGKPTSPQTPPAAAHSAVTPQAVSTAQPATPQAPQSPQPTTAPPQQPTASQAIPASQPTAAPQTAQAPQPAAPQSAETPQPTASQATQASRSSAAPLGAQAPQSDASQAVSVSQAARASRSSVASQGAQAPRSDASQAVSASEPGAGSRAVQAPQAAAPQSAEASQSTVAPQAGSVSQATRATESSAPSQEAQAPQAAVSQAVSASEAVAGLQAARAAQSSAAPQASQASQAAAAPQGGSAPQSGSAAQSEVVGSADDALQSGVVPQVDSVSQLDVASETEAGRADNAAQVGSGSQGDVASAGQRAGGVVQAGSGSEADAAGVAAQGGAGSDAVGNVGVAEGVVPRVGGLEGELLREVEGRWGEIRAKVREFGAAVHALLSGAAVARVDGDVIVFAHQHAPLAQRLSNPKYVEAVEAAVHAVLGRRHGVRWEVGAAAAPARNQAAAPARESGRAPARGGQSGRSEQSQPRFTRPSQARAASPDASQARGREGSSTEADSASRFAPPDDDIPLPDGPDYPDDPGPTDYSPVGYDGVPPASTEEEEREMLAESARPVPPGDRRDPDEVALELLRTELGATRLDG